MQTQSEKTTDRAEPRSVFGNFQQNSGSSSRAPDERPTRRGPSDVPASETLQQQINGAVARGFVYRFLAKAYENPTRQGWKWLCRKQVKQTLDVAMASLVQDRSIPFAEITALAGQLKLKNFEAIESSYLTAFGHTVRGDCPLNEIEYGDIKADPLFQPHRLADLAAFYSAFGLEISEDATERQDHICLELEFMSVLAMKEAYALENQLDFEQLAICRDAQKKFLHEHLARWTPAFTRRLAKNVSNTPLEAIARFTQSFILLECRRYGISPGSEDLMLRPIDETSERLCESCGIQNLLPGALRSLSRRSMRAAKWRRSLPAATQNMQLRYDDDFLESAILIFASGKRSDISPLQIRRFHHEREKLYSILEADERNAAFFKLHAEWFREWNLEKPLRERLKNFPLLEKSLNILAFRKARSQNDEGAELYVNASEKNGVVALRVERFAKNESLEPFLNHELSHLRDMTDPRFGYERRIRGDPAQQRLVCDRYRLLWDITIDGRLASKNMPGAGSREMRRQEFDRAFIFWTDVKREETFQSLWTASEPRHEDLMALAADPRDLAHVHQPIPGALCPLCNFPTFDWADESRFNETTIPLIQREFPNWTREKSACNRCLEMYEALRRYSLAEAS